jgi:hypothetical protein
MSPLTPGAEIRKNATSFGIPLCLPAEDVHMPIPVRTTSGAVVVPSPVNYGCMQPQHLQFGMCVDSAPTGGFACAHPAAGVPQVLPGGAVHANAPSYTTTGPLGFPIGVAPISNIRGIVTPSRAGLPRTGGA